jgi:hypothetical protein
MISVSIELVAADCDSFELPVGDFDSGLVAR